MVSFVLASYEVFDIGSADILVAVAAFQMVDKAIQAESVAADASFGAYSCSYSLDIQAFAFVEVAFASLAFGPSSGMNLYHFCYMGDDTYPFAYLYPYYPYLFLYFYHKNHFYKILNDHSYFYHFDIYLYHMIHPSHP